MLGAQQVILLLYIARRQMVFITICICILIFFLGESNYHYHDVLSITQLQQKFGSKGPITMVAGKDNVFENFAKQLGNISKQFEYTVDISGKQIFPNETLKQDIVSNYKSSTYNISTLKYSLLGFDITASDIKIQVKPSRLDSMRTKVDLPIMLAREVSITNGLLNLKYNEVNLSAIYGIYDKASDKITIHIPFNIALRYLPHNL
jgi:hypothetical protein